MEGGKYSPLPRGNEWFVKNEVNNVDMLDKIRISEERTNNYVERDKYICTVLYIIFQGKVGVSTEHYR